MALGKLQIMIPFNDPRRRFAQSGSELRELWSEFMKAGVFIGGQPVETFEAQFADYCEVEYCVAVGNGTDALEFALRAVGVGTGDEVITVANAGGYTTTACQAIGSIPVYIDVESDSCQIDVRQLPGALSNKTRALVITHLYGWMNDVTEVRALLMALGRSDIRIIEDCAQAHGASRDGAKAGSLGDISTFSFYPTKNLGAVGDAGAVVTQDIDLATKVRRLRQYGWVKKYESVVPHGRNSRMDPIQALVLQRELPKLDAANAARRDICRRYREALKDGWSLVYDDAPSFVAHLAVLIAEDPERRDRALAHLRAREIGCDIHYPILDCDQRAWQKSARVAGGLEVSQSLTQRILSLPLFPELNAEELDQIVDALHSI